MTFTVTSASWQGLLITSVIRGSKDANSGRGELSADWIVGYPQVHLAGQREAHSKLGCLRATVLGWEGPQRSFSQLSTQPTTHFTNESGPQGAKPHVPSDKAGAAG